MNGPIKVTLRGVKYRVKFVKSIPRRKSDKKHDEVLGDCDSPKAKHPLIRLCDNEGTTEESMCEIALHELLHGCVWKLPERVVAETAESMQRALYKMGFRLVRKSKPKAAH